jgi:hypothetical protein
MSFLASAAAVRPPIYNATPSATNVPLGVVQRLAGTGATGAENAIAMPTARYATLMVGDEDVRVRFGTGTVEADTTDIIVKAGTEFSWYVESDCDIVSVQAADGASAFEAWVWCSSPRVS